MWVHSYVQLSLYHFAVAGMSQSRVGGFHKNMWDWENIWCARVHDSLIAVAEPPSQRSSRGPSPVNEQSYDALEGQFSPGQGKTASFQATPFSHFFIFLPGWAFHSLFLLPSRLKPFHSLFHLSSRLSLSFTFSSSFRAEPFIHFHLPSRLSLSFTFIFLPLPG